MGAAELGAPARGPQLPAQLPSVSPAGRQLGERLTGSEKSPFTAGAGPGHLARPLLLPHRSRSVSASLTAAATESLVTKRIKKHLHCDCTSCQKYILTQKMKTAFMFNLQKFILKYHTLLYV